MSYVVKPISVVGRMIGCGHPCFIVAEAGVNHNGEIEKAHQLIDVAVAAGADAVKFQTFKADCLALPNAPKAGYQEETTGKGESQFEMLRRLELSPHEHQELIDHCRQRGILFLSTPFDHESADLLWDLGVPAFKVPSGELTDLPFIAHVARMGKPMIVSTGMSSLAEVEAAVRTVGEAGNRDLILLHCVSCYPAKPADANLRAMRTMATAFLVPVGYSDHTLGIEVALAAVAMGACVLEKHLTLDRALPGPDHRASLEPDEFVRLVAGIRTVESALGNGCKSPAAGEAEIAMAARRSLVAATDILAGCKLTKEMVVAKRPGTGLPPAMQAHVVGRCAKQDIPAGTLLTLDMVV